jgi:hypothetical protein
VAGVCCLLAVGVREDLVGGFDPGERVGALVPTVDEGELALDELSQDAENASGTQRVPTHDLGWKPGPGAPVFRSPSGPEVTQRDGRSQCVAPRSTP